VHGGRVEIPGILDYVFGNLRASVDANKKFKADVAKWDSDKQSG